MATGAKMQGRPLDTRARAVYDLSEGRILAAVEIPSPTEEVFKALIGQEVIKWWVNPGVFDTREWVADVRPGGVWHAAGIGRGQPYKLEGEFTEINSPDKLVHTWRSGGEAESSTTVTYLLNQIPGGTRLTLRHEGFKDPPTLIRTCIGWETSFAALGSILSAE